MALFDDIPDGGNLVTGLIVGAGALIAWPLISPIARPLAKSIIKGGMITYRQAEQLYASAVEGVSEMAREAQQEIGATPTAQGHADGSAPRGNELRRGVVVGVGLDRPQRAVEGDRERHTFPASGHIRLRFAPRSSRVPRRYDVRNLRDRSVTTIVTSKMRHSF